MRMQSSIFIWTALKIHVSPATKSVLDQFSSFILETRGETEMKVRSLAILLSKLKRPCKKYPLYAIKHDNVIVSILG